MASITPYRPSSAPGSDGNAPRRLLVGWVGDCRVVVSGGGGRARALTTDHTPERPSELARVTAGPFVWPLSPPLPMRRPTQPLNSPSRIPLSSAQILLSGPSRPLLFFTPPMVLWCRHHRCTGPYPAHRPYFARHAPFASLTRHRPCIPASLGVRLLLRLLQPAAG